MLTIIYGPPGSGKTSNRKALKALCGADHVVDDWDGDFADLPDGDVLVLTNMTIEDIRVPPRDVVIISTIEYALEELA
jgi:hypothetical protein